MKPISEIKYSYFLAPLEIKIANNVLDEKITIPEKYNKLITPLAIQDGMDVNLANAIRQYITDKTKNSPNICLGLSNYNNGYITDVKIYIHKPEFPLNLLGFDNFLTPQEHLLMGSTSNPEHKKEMYMPTAIYDSIDKKIVEGLRTFAQVFETNAGLWMKDNEQLPMMIKVNGKLDINYILAKLMPLDDNGRTIKDPEDINNDYKLDQKYSRKCINVTE